MLEKIRQRSSTLTAVGLVALAYLYVFPSFPQINSPNENVRVYMTAAIVEEGTYAIDALRARWGWVNDAAIFGGHAYSVKAPGTSLLGLPAYAAYFHATRVMDIAFDREVALWWLRVTATILPALVFLWFFHRFLDRMTRHAILRDAVFYSVALGSLFFGYALVFVSHTTSAAVAFGAFMLLYRARRTPDPSIGAAFLAGMLSAGVTLFEYPGFVASLVLSIYALFALKKVRRIVPFALGALLPTLMMMHFQWRAFGSPFRPGHIYVETTALREAHHEGLYGANAFHWEAVYGLLFDPGAGLFPLTPILIAGVFGVVILCRRRAYRVDAYASAALVGLSMLVIFFMNNWRGGWTIGPRYLAVVVPFVAWWAVIALDRAYSRAPRSTAAFALGALVIGWVLSGLPSMYYPHLPEDLRFPIAHLIRVLVAHDYAPHNAGAFLEIFGTPSMLPELFVLLIACLVTLWSFREGLGRALVAAGALALAVVAVYPLATARDDAASRQARAFVTRTWSPKGQDTIAKLKVEFAANPTETLARALQEAYEEEGRDEEAGWVHRSR